MKQYILCKEVRYMQFLTDKHSLYMLNKGMFSTEYTIDYKNNQTIIGKIEPQEMITIRNAKQMKNIEWDNIVIKKEDLHLKLKGKVETSLSILIDILDFIFDDLLD